MPASAKSTGSKSASYADVASEDVKTTAGRRKTAAGASKKAPALMIKYYLVAYNLLSFAAWLAILALLLVHVVSPSHAPALASTAKSTTASKLWNSVFNSAASTPSTKRAVAFDRLRGAYSAVGPLTKIVQTFAVLEVVHAAVGFVRSPVATTAAQVASRLWTVWGVVELFTAPRESPAYSLLIFAWSATEVVRYLYYALNLVGIEPFPLLWARYTTFFPLYPLGAGAEAYLSLLVLPPLARLPIVGSSIAKGLHAVLPASYVKGRFGLLSLAKSTQSWGLVDYFRGVLVLIWPAALVVMYTYMISQRKKALRAASGKGKTLKTA